MNTGVQDVAKLLIITAPLYHRFGYRWKLRCVLLKYFYLAIFCALLTGCSHSAKKDSGKMENTVKIISTDNGLFAPDTILAGMSHIVFSNHGSELHEAMFIKLPAGMSAEDHIEKVKDGFSFPEGAIDYSGPGLTSPGKEISIWLHLDPGEYFLACWYRSHLTATPIQTLIVENLTSGNIEPPKADVVLKMIDFRFEFQGKLNKGEQVIQVETLGPSMHEVDIFRLSEGKTLEDVREWHKNEKKGPSPVQAFGGVLDNHDISRTIWIKTELFPGQYILWCGMPMVANYQGSGVILSHAEAGMYMEFVIED